MSEQAVVVEGPISEVTVYENGVQIFRDYNPEECRKAPDGQHQWDGPEIRFDNGGAVTCSLCGLDAMTHSMRTML